MTKEQEAHLEQVKKETADSLDIKYRLGQEEHGGNVWERTIILELSGELTDLVVYLNCLSRKRAFIQEGVAIVKQALQRGDTVNALDVLDIVNSSLRNL